MSKEKKELNILDQVKQTEKLNLLMENMKQLKVNTLKMNELKKQNKEIFEKVGLNDEEVKQITDYVKSIKIEKTVDSTFNEFDGFHNPSITIQYPDNFDNYYRIF